MAVGSVVQGLSPMVFATLMEPHVRMAIWSRPSPCPDPGAVTPLEARCDGHWIAAPMDAPDWLLADIETLGEIFSVVLGQPGWRARCERVVERACPRFHQDAVPVRMITTYAGPGSEWAFARELEDDLDAQTAEVRRRIRTLTPGDVAILKGSAPGWEPWPDFPVVLHRSPPASRSVPRLVLTLDPFEASIVEAADGENADKLHELSSPPAIAAIASSLPTDPTPEKTMVRPLLLSCALALSALTASPTLTDVAGAVQAPSPPAPQASATQAAPFALPDLPYAADSLEPAIDTETMRIHHDRHHKAYVDNLNAAVADPALAGQSLEQLLANVSALPAAVRNNGGGHWNHSFFWTIMGPVGQGGAPSAELAAAIDRDFGSMDAFKQAFNRAATSRFGSGWAWLIVQDGKLKITSTPNQDNPLMDVADDRGAPVLGVDVWEHAYYLKYQNSRPDYLTAWWSVVNWNEVSRRFAQAR